VKSFRFSCLSRHLSLAAGVAAISGVVLSLGGVRVAWGQGPFTATGIPPIAVAPRAQIDDLSTGVKSHLSRVDAFLADKQYDEAIHGLRQIMEEHADELVEDVDPGDGAQQDRGPASIRKYIPLRRWCQKKLLSLADTHPDALDLYRRRVDPANATSPATGYV